MNNRKKEYLRQFLGKFVFWHDLAEETKEDILEGTDVIYSLSLEPVELCVSKVFLE